MIRRDFITFLGVAAVAWPLAARAQQPDRTRRVGVLMNLPTDDPEAQRLVAAFLQGLQQFGWRDGHNVRIEYRFAADQGNVLRYAAELIALAPEVILAYANPSVAALQQATRTPYFASRKRQRHQRLAIGGFAERRSQLTTTQEHLDARKLHERLSLFFRCRFCSPV
jgi:hypothetical protein